MADKLSDSVNRLRVIGLLAALACALTLNGSASADSFGSTYYDRVKDELVVTMRYQGTNPNHRFTLQWGACQSTDDSEGMPKVDVLVLDDQFMDAAHEDYQVIEHFSLADLPCPRPVTMDLYTAPRIFLPVVIPVRGQ